MKLSFDSKLSVGNIITIIVVVVGGLTAFTTVRGDVSNLKEVVSAHEPEVDKIDVIENDIGYIKESLKRIERKLDE